MRLRRLRVTCGELVGGQLQPGLETARESRRGRGWSANSPCCSPGSGWPAGLADPLAPALALALAPALDAPLPLALACAYILRSCGSNNDIGSSLNFFLMVLVADVKEDDDEEEAAGLGAGFDGPPPLPLPLAALLPAGAVGSMSMLALSPGSAQGDDAIRATPLYRYRNGRWRCWSRRVNDRDTSTVRSDLSGYDVAAEFVSVVLERGPATRDSAEVVVGDEGGVAGG